MCAESFPQSKREAAFDIGRFGILALGIATVAAMAYFIVETSLGNNWNAQVFLGCGFTPGHLDPLNDAGGGLVVWIFAAMAAFAIESSNCSDHAPLHSPGPVGPTKPIKSTIVSDTLDQDSYRPAPFQSTVFALFFGGFLAVTFAASAIFQMIDGHFPLLPDADISEYIPASVDDAYNFLVRNAGRGILLALEFVAAFVLERQYSTAIYRPKLFRNQSV